MLGLVREYFSYNVYSHDYHEDAPNQTFHVYKRSYHLYDLAVFIIIFTFLCAYFYTLFTSFEQGEYGYIFGVISIIGISSMMY